MDKIATITRSTSSPKNSPLPKKSERRPTGNKKTFYARRRQERTERLSVALFAAIKLNYNDTIFTRDDLLALTSEMGLDREERWAKLAYGINDFTVATQYRRIREATQLLLQTGRLVALDWLRLCLPHARLKLQQEPPLHLTYISTITRIVQSFPNHTLIDVMSVVAQWKSDQHLPPNVKKMTTRDALRQLQRDKLLRLDSNTGQLTVALPTRSRTRDRGELTTDQ